METDDYDSPWKDVIEEYFLEFMAFYFPGAYEQIEWAAGFRFLDKEFQQIAREADHGRRYVDKLVAVKKTNGDDGWLYIHVEVQGSPEEDFSRRMFIYYSRIFDKHERPVASLAILADDVPDWLPGPFAQELFGCKATLDFPVVKLLQYEGRQDALIESDNPFALVTVAHLMTKRTAKDPAERFQTKYKLAKWLFGRSWDKQRIYDLFRFLDWIMRLPEDLENRLFEQINREDKKMKYVSTFERKYMEKGMEKGMERGMEMGRQEGRKDGEIAALLHVLAHRFGPVPEPIISQIRQASAEQILSWTDKALDANLLDDVFQRE